MKSRFNKQFAIAQGLLQLGLVSGCSGTTDVRQGYEESSSSVSEELAAVSSATTLWNANGNVVDVCWVTSGFATAKDKVKAAIISSWGANSGLTFTWPANPATDVCPPLSPGSNQIAAHYMPIQIFSETVAGGWGGSCVMGYNGRQTSCVGTSRDCQCQFSDAHLETDTFLTAPGIHEIGHGLGLPHEHQRADRPSNIASTCVDPSTQVNKWTVNSNYIQDNSFRLLTEYDGLKSIMSYCRDFNDDGSWDNPPFNDLSELDKLGIEMLYPFNLSRRPVLSNGVSSSNYAQTVVRTDVVTTLKIDWVARGGLATALSGIQWRDGGGVFSTAASPSLTITTNRTIELALDDVLGRHHGWTGTSVVASNALHAAITMPNIAVL